MTTPAPLVDGVDSVFVATTSFEGRRAVYSGVLGLPCTARY
jgi:hypothetical protein